MFEPPDRIEQYLRHNFPDHVHGYRMGWLKVERIETYDAIHLYSREDSESKWELFGTVI